MEFLVLEICDEIFVWKFASGTFGEWKFASGTFVCKLVSVVFGVVCGNL